MGRRSYGIEAIAWEGDRQMRLDTMNALIGKAFRMSLIDTPDKKRLDINVISLTR